MTRQYWVLNFVTALVTLSGCRSFEGLADPYALSMVDQEPRTKAFLASHRMQAGRTQPPTDRQQPRQDRRDQPEARAQTEDSPLADPETQKSEKTLTPTGYTAPGAAIRHAAMLAMGVPSSDEDTAMAATGGGKELAESMLGTSTAVTPLSVLGSVGLTAPQPTVATAVVSRRGLQEGPASGIGFASSFNILTPQVNPLSGPMGRCNDLVRAGFFGGNTANCVRHFRPK